MADPLGGCFFWVFLVDYYNMEFIGYEFFLYQCFLTMSQGSYIIFIYWLLDRGVLGGDHPLLH